MPTEFWALLLMAAPFAGYALGGWWATRLTRRERRLVARYLYYPPVSDIHLPTSTNRPRGDAF
jgi:hypothetical protein